MIVTYDKYKEETRFYYLLKSYFSLYSPNTVWGDERWAPAECEGGDPGV